MDKRSKRATVIAVCGVALAVGLAASVTDAQSTTKSTCHVDKFDTHFKSYEISCTRLLQQDKLSKKERAEAHFLRSLWYRENRRYDEAEADLRIVLSMFPDHARAANRLGDVIFDRSRDYQEARKWVLRSIELDPTRPYAFGSLGYFERSVGRNTEAVDALTRAIEIKPSYAWARHKRARALQSLQRWDEVLVDTAYLTTKSNKLTDLGPVTAYQRDIDMRFDAALMHGRALRAKNAFETAEKWYNALVADYANQIAFLARANFLSGLPVGRGMLNCAREALADAEKAIQLNPSFAAAYRQKATLLRVDFNRSQEAFQLLAKAIKLRRVDYRSPYLTWEQALSLRRLGKRTEAEALTLNAIHQSSQIGSPFAYFLLKRLAKHGYFVPPKSPDHINQAIRDAVTACMLDERCL